MMDEGRTYWLNLFTGKTWDEFRKAGTAVAGFRRHSAATCQRIRSGDVLLCYLTGVKLWVGAVEVVGPSTDTTRIWADDAFPVRLEVRPLVILEAVYGVPLEDLKGRVSFYALFRRIAVDTAASSVRAWQGSSGAGMANW